MLDAPLEGDTISLAFSSIANVLHRRLKCRACRLVESATAGLLPKKARRSAAMLAPIVWPQDSILITYEKERKAVSEKDWCKESLGQSIDPI